MKQYLDDTLKALHKKNSIGSSSKDIIPFDQSIGIKKVAYDIYKVMNDEYGDYWKLENIDGKDFLIRGSIPDYDIKVESDWSATPSADGTLITLSYKNVPVKNYENSVYGFQKDDISAFKSALLDEVSSNKEFVKGVLLSQPKQKVEALTNVFPELKKNI